MEETFAGLVAEVEKAVLPFGFRVETAERRDKTPLISGGFKADDSVRITIVRNGKVG
jgi:hypothetical protein